MSPHPTQQKVSFTAPEICFQGQFPCLQSRFIDYYLFLASVRVKKSKERNRKPKRAAATFLLELEGLLKPSAEVSSDSLLLPLSVPKSLLQLDFIILQVPVVFFLP